MSLSDIFEDIANGDIGDALGGFGDFLLQGGIDIYDWLRENPQAIGTFLGGVAPLLLDNDPEPIGYQGGVPMYDMHREQIAYDYQDPNTQPDLGSPSYGKRYFTDVTYSLPQGLDAQTAGVAPNVVMPTYEDAADATTYQRAALLTGDPRTVPTTRDYISDYLNRVYPFDNEDEGTGNPTDDPTYTPDDPRNPPPDGLDYFAQGGLASLGRGYYLGGMTDGMADQVPATVEGQEQARLSDGEFVVPADVVSHLGNGNSNAGAKQLYEMMDRIRKARTGSEQQGRQINPNQFMPS